MGKAAVRRAQPADADVLIEFNREMARETEGVELDERSITTGVRTLLANDALGFYVVAEIGTEIVGSLMVTTEWSDWRNGDFWWIQSVYVKTQYRRRGIYRSLYESIKRQADKAQNVCGFRLYVERDNSVAQRTYQSLGMRETAYRIFEELNS